MLESGPPMLYVVAQEEETRRKLREVRDASTDEETHVLLREAQEAMASAMKSIHGTFDGAAEIGKAVLKDLNFEKADLSKFEIEGTAVCGSKHLSNVIEYMAHMRIGALLLSLFCLISTPIFYTRVYLPCWECYDFKATMAHEVGHLLGFEHPDQYDKLNLQSDKGGVDAFTAAPTSQQKSESLLNRQGLL